MHQLSAHFVSSCHNNLITTELQHAANIRFLLENNYLTSVEIVNLAFEKKTKGFEQLNKDLPLKVTEVNCKGKFCYIALSNGSYIGIKFGMAGCVRLPPTQDQLDNRKETYDQYMKHMMVAFQYTLAAAFLSGTEPTEMNTGLIYYNDYRRFGHVWYLTPREFQKQMSQLGPCILATEILSDAEVVKLFRKRNHTNICKVLMEQDTISGVGAYIKAEILYACKVHPLAAVKDLSDETLVALYHAARDVAHRAYVAGGASLYTYTGISGDRSDFKDELAVYGKSHDPLGNLVVRIPDSESPDKRATHWVPELQIIGQPIPVALPAAPVSTPSPAAVPIRLSIRPSIRAPPIAVVPIQPMPVPAQRQAPIQVSAETSSPAQISQISQKIRILPKLRPT